MPVLPLHALPSVPRAGDAPVCRRGTLTVNWRAFLEDVARRSEGIRRHGVERWLLAADDACGFATGLLAILHAGRQAVIPPNTQPGTLARLASAYDAAPADVPDGPCDAASGDAPGLAPIDPHRPAIHIYTSGSTGEPKPVRKTLAQFQAEVATLEALWGEAIGDAGFIATAPHAHFYGLLFRVLWPLATGRVFDAATIDTPSLLHERLACFAPAAVLVSSPAQLTRLPELLPLGGLRPVLRHVFSSGGPLPAGTALVFRQQFGEAPTEVFGSTETGGIGWRQQAEDDAWTPMPGMRITRGELGALQLRSPFLPDPDTVFEMDDAVAISPDDGRFRLPGRLDRTVKIEEKRVSLPDLEARLASHPWVAQAAAVLLQRGRLRIGAAAVLTPEGRDALEREGHRLLSRALRLHLSGHFDAVVLPRHWRFPPQLPVNERGKLPAAAVAALFHAEDDSDVRAVAA
ncbi:AMP-binding protein [Paracidovorax avenae]|uniref:AMP-binding protein n=1 Tax=Paracidovorax avenae TaxID=80867 RepID=UPI001F399182|nr:AMP-binding protein [Paracidovorax avenae]